MAHGANCGGACLWVWFSWFIQSAAPRPCGPARRVVRKLDKFALFLLCRCAALWPVGRLIRFFSMIIKPRHTLIVSADECFLVNPCLPAIGINATYSAWFAHTLSPPFGVGV